jgi:RNA polymerase sigma-70 factor (ECF subfamily)
MRHVAEPELIVEVEALAAAAAGGDEVAMTELYERYVDPIYRFVHIRTRDHANTEDLCQDVWMRVVRAIGKYEPARGGFPAWLFTIAGNAVKDYYRRSSCRPETPTADMLYLNSPSIEVSPEESAERGEVSAQLAKAMGALPSKQRQCVTLRFFNGLSLAETAAVMGMTVGNVKVTQHRALKVLATTLPPEMRILGTTLSVSHVHTAVGSGVASPTGVR